MPKKTNFESQEYISKLDAWWRAANYLSVAQMYLRDNPLIEHPLKQEDVKLYPIGHWGTIPGQNFIYAHLNRVINKYDLDMFYIEGPGHGGQVMISNSYLDGSYSTLYPHIKQDLEGMKKLCKRFSFPGGSASHAAPETPGSIHEGGELGYSLSHAVGAILDNPKIIAAAVIGDGEAETGPLCASWFSNFFINPVNDGAVLPIVHVNGGKISNPTIFARKTNEELINYFKGMNWEAIIVEGDADNHMEMHQTMIAKMDYAIEQIQKIQAKARKKPANEAKMPNWPVLIVRTPKGWTGPKTWDKLAIEGSFRAHQVPIPVNAIEMKYFNELYEWLSSYHPEELFNKNGSLKKEIAELAPKGKKRMGLHPITNGGVNPKPMKLGNWEEFGLDLTAPGSVKSQDMVNLGKYTAKLMQLNPTNFRIFGPDETKSNRLYDVFKVTNRQWMGAISKKFDEWVAPEGRVIDSQLSEHQAEGFLEGYVLTGRHGYFASYESFLRIIDSMLTQHMKWMKKLLELPWRNHLPSLNVIATSTAFQQDHNGYTHQDPGLLGHLADKRPELVREYLPADTNCLLATMEKSLSDKNVINLIVASKQPRDQWFSKTEAKELVEKGYKIIDWASTTKGNEEPDLVMVSSGVEPTLETLAAISILNKEFPNLKIRYVNVLDILKLRHKSIDSRGLCDNEFDEVFTKDKPIVFAYHGFEAQIRDIFFNRHNHNLKIHGYREEGDITTSFDIRQLSHMDRFHISQTAAEMVYGEQGKEFIKKQDEMLAYHTSYIQEYGFDIPEVVNWKWTKLNK